MGLLPRLEILTGTGVSVCTVIVGWFRWMCSLGWGSCHYGSRGHTVSTAFYLTGVASGLSHQYFLLRAVRKQLELKDGGAVVK